MIGFERTGHRERLSIGPGLAPSGERLPFADRGAALALLHDLGKDAWGMGALRRIYAEARGGASICTEGDAAVLEGLARRLVTGELKARRVPLSPAPVPHGGEVTAAAAPAKKKAVEEKAPGTLTNPRWSVPRVEVGVELFAIVTYTGLTKPVNATIVISELDRSTAKQEIAKVHTTVPAGSGNHKVAWKRKPEEAQEDIAADTAAGDSGPLEYRFQVETKDPACPGESGPLWLTHTVELNLEAEDGAAVPDAVEVTLWDVLGDDFQGKAEKGKAKFEKILVGPFKVQIGPPPPALSRAKWSTEKVAVGAEVEGSFSYKRLQDSEEVLVQIFEINADGSATVVDQLTEKVSGTSGDHTFKWKRSAEGANADVAQDAEEGDSGPLDYRFEVSASGAHSPPRSGPLWLTHTVELDLSHGEGGKPFADGIDLRLTGPDGTEHKAKTSGGKVRFEGVMVGPMTIALAPPGSGS